MGGAASAQNIDGPSWIAAYRAALGRPDMFGNVRGLDESDTAAVAEIDGRIVFGINSGAFTHTSADRVTAQRYMDAMIQKYPDVMSVDNIGQKPNDALYHAEATILLRAVKESGGTLAGRAIIVHIDREVCWSCDLALPKLGLELGNPMVTYIDPHSVLTMRDGRWINRTRR